MMPRLLATALLVLCSAGVLYAQPGPIFGPPGAWAFSQPVIFNNTTNANSNVAIGGPVSAAALDVTAMGSTSNPTAIFRTQANQNGNLLSIINSQGTTIASVASNGNASFPNMATTPIGNANLVGPLVSSITAGNGISVTNPGAVGAATVTNNIAAGSGVSITGTNPLTIAITNGATFSAAASGYTRLPNGIQLQWTSANFVNPLAGSTTAAITWPLAFPTAYFQGIASFDRNGVTLGTTSISAAIESGTTTGATAIITVGAALTGTIIWRVFAIGN